MMMMPNNLQAQLPASSQGPARLTSAPRMSNAFARRHGLNPKANPAPNLQKISMHNQNNQYPHQVGPRNCFQ